MKALSPYECWLVTGSQHLYGEEVLQTVASHSSEIAGFLDQTSLPVNVIFKPVVKSPDEIYQLMLEANQSSNCVGIIAWMHTFSPAKMWIAGLNILRKPMAHLHTQYNRDIPWDTIDMDFMNLNQSAHGDREFGFICTRMKISRKVIVGHWKDPKVLARLDSWCRAACAWQDWQGGKFCRFGDNMRQVAVTEGDKVEAQMKFGYAVNTHGVGDLVDCISKVANTEIDRLCDEYEATYQLAATLKRKGSTHGGLRIAARIEAGLRAFLTAGGFKGFTDTFEDLHGLEQLPGIATQRLMHSGFGFAAEGDWKTAALVRAMKVMATGLAGGNSFMEDYTYHFEPGNEMVLGAHMLEICPSIADGNISCEIHALSIGGKSDPVRLVFNGSAGKALNASIIDLGNRFRLLVNEVESVAVPRAMPRLPVARVLWKPLPDLATACAGWILAGGAHHTCYSQNLSVEHLQDFAEIAGIEMVVIGNGTSIDSLKQEMRTNEVYYR